jgi:Flp pilus assembly protein CpaB
LANGLLAVKLGVEAVRRAQATGQAHKTIKVVQAKTDISAFDQIRADMVEMTETFDSPLVPPGDRIGDLQKAIGRVSGKAIPRGSPVLQSMLAPEGTPPGLTGRIPTGFRACSVKIDEVTGVAYQLKTGDWVDVIVVMDVQMGGSSARAKKETVAEVILQRVQVAAVGYDATPEAADKNLKVKPAKSATLLVREQDVPKLHLAGTRGKITLAMRGDQDTTSGVAAIAFDSEIGGQSPPDELPTSPKPKETPGAGAPAPWQLFAAGEQPRLPEPPQPSAVMVFHGSAGGAQATMFEQVTFAGPNSAKIVELTLGAPSRAASTLRGLNTSSSAPAARLSPPATAAPVVPAAPEPADVEVGSQEDEPSLE